MLCHLLKAFSCLALKTGCSIVAHRGTFINSVLGFACIASVISALYWRVNNQHNQRVHTFPILSYHPNPLPDCSGIPVKFLAC